MLWLILILAAGGALVLAKGTTTSSSSSQNSTPAIGTFPEPDNSMNLPDVNPLSQQGGWDDSHDTAFMHANSTLGVPFALMKAHAIRESALKSDAIRIEPTGKASYGLMQILWWPGSNRFKNYGYSDDQIGDGSLLYDDVVNCTIAANIIMDNWDSCRGNLRDTINMYNTGVKESVRKAPNSYVDNVLSNYNKLIGRNVL